MVGIYKITNKINNKVYIGQSVNIESRWNQHRHNLDNNIHINKHLQSAWNKYGSDCFEFTIIEKCTVKELTNREQFWLDFFGGMDSNKTYNNRDAGNKGHLSTSSKLKLRLRHLGKKCGPLSITTKQKISKSLKGRPAHNRGKILTPETKQKISESLKGKNKPPFSEKHKKNLSISHKGKPAWNKGIPNKYKGSHLTPEQIMKARDKPRKNKYAVSQYTLDGVLITNFQSTMEAERLTGVANSNIGACCRGLQKTAGGFVWKKQIQ